MKNLLVNYNLNVLQSEKMGGYANSNYKLNTTTGTYVLKHYLNPDEYELINAENRLIAQTSKQLVVELPEPIAPLKKLKDQSFTRLLSFVEGELLGSTSPSNELLFNFGASIAQLTSVLLTKKSSVIKARKHEWDLQHCLLNRSKTNYIENPTQCKLVHYFFDLFEHYVLPKQDFLRQALIHGDLNENNVLVKDNKVQGFIDFGDCCYAPIINEVAIAITYVMLMHPNDPCTKASYVIKGYHSVFPLLKEEINLLYYLIAARLCVSVCNASEAIAKQRDSAHILMNQKAAWSFLEKYISFNPIALSNQFLAAVNLENMTASNSVVLEKRSRYLPKALSLSYDKPIYMSTAAFQYMHDHKGNCYLDAYNNIPHVGHCHPKISQVISKKARILNTNTRYLYNELGDYAEKLLSYFPKSLNTVFFVNSGSAATDLASRIAANYTQRSSFVVLEHGYHGNTQMAMSLSPYKFDGKGGFGLPKGRIKLPLPNLFNGAFSSSQDYVNDAKSKIAKAIENGHVPAAFFAEPISGCGGQVPLATEYLKKLKPFLEQHSILFVSDEVQTGFGRLGNHFWGFEMHGIVPDMVILGKPMANGHPIGAVVTSREIADSFANGMEFFSSFGGNPVSCAIGHEVLRIVEDERLQENALNVGAYYKTELEKLKSEFSCIADVRGQGLFLGFELLDSAGQPDILLAHKIKNDLKENFILVSTDGPFDNVIKSKPPLCFNSENVNTVISSIRRVLND